MNKTKVKGFEEWLMGFRSSLTQTGKMNEMSALMKIEDWKEKRWR